VQKRKSGFLLPVDLVDAAMRQFEGRIDGKSKWLVVSAGLLSLMELPEAEQNEYIRRLKNADSPGQTFAALVNQAEALRRGRETGRGARRPRVLIHDPEEEVPAGGRRGR
jgi:hypothetical protein